MLSKPVSTQMRIAESSIIGKHHTPNATYLHKLFIKCSRHNFCYIHVSLDYPMAVAWGPSGRCQLEGRSQLCQTFKISKRRNKWSTRKHCVTGQTATKAKPRLSSFIFRSISSSLHVNWWSNGISAAPVCPPSLSGPPRLNNSRIFLFPRGLVCRLICLLQIHPMYQNSSLRGQGRRGIGYGRRGSR